MCCPSCRACHGTAALHIINRLIWPCLAVHAAINDSDLGRDDLGRRKLKEHIDAQTLKRQWDDKHYCKVDVVCRWAWCSVEICIACCGHMAMCKFTVQLPGKRMASRHGGHCASPFVQNGCARSEHLMARGDMSCHSLTARARQRLASVHSHCQACLLRTQDRMVRQHAGDRHRALLCRAPFQWRALVAAMLLANIKSLLLGTPALLTS